MFDIYLVIALAMTFGSIVCAGIAYNLVLDRRRSRRMLELQVTDRQDLSMRELELSASMLERLFLPAISMLARLGRNLLPGYSRATIERRLVLSGSSQRWTVERVAGTKMLAGAGGLLLGLLLGSAMGASGLTLLGVAILTTIMGFFAPDAILSRRADARQEEIRRSLPDVMDLLTISVEAGLAFDAALVEVLKVVPGPISQEFARMLQEMRLGVSRIDALKHLETRTDVIELRSFILAISQADSFGVSISHVLRSQATELRVKRRQDAEEQAMKVPIKILFPMIFCVLPSLFVVLIGPGIIRIAESFFKIEV